MERFMSFTWNRFRFIDSYQFLSASLDRLASSTPDDALILSSTLDNHRLLKRKGMESYARILFLWVSEGVHVYQKKKKKCASIQCNRVIVLSLPNLLLLCALGVYPYEYMDSMDRFDETHLPPKVSSIRTIYVCGDLSLFCVNWWSCQLRSSFCKSLSQSFVILLSSRSFCSIRSEMDHFYVSQDKFFSRLTKSHVSDEDYRHAQEVRL